MGATLGGKGSMSAINMTPLIDIVLVVLIIMMVNMPVPMEELGVKLPAETRIVPPSAKPPDQLVIALYDDGSVALNRSLMPEDVLFEQLTLRLRPKRKKVVFVDAHPQADYGRVVRLMDAAKGAGAVVVGLGKLKPDGPAAPTQVWEGTLPRGVLAGSPGIVGATNERLADEALQPVLPAVRGCWEQALAAGVRRGGRLIVRVEVGPDGQLLAEPATVEDTVGDPGLAACVLGAMGAIRWAPLGPDATAAVQFPILFSPG